MSDFRELSETVTELVAGGSVLTIQPGGNYGDSLIYKGARKLFTDRDIATVPLRSGEIRNDSAPPFEVGLNPIAVVKRLRRELDYLRRRLHPDIATVYIHGGGNFNDIWGAGVWIFETVARHFDVPIVVGPQSCQFTRTDPRSVFEGVDNTVHLFTRERYSYDQMSAVSDAFENLTVHLEDDTALYLEQADLPVESLTDRYVLAALRRDKESAGAMIDESLDPPVLARDISVDVPSFETFVETAANARKIYTDRLHGAILSTLLGKPTRFYGNAYHKNRGVYEYSLSTYDHIEFVADAESV